MYGYSSGVDDWNFEGDFKNYNQYSSERTEILVVISWRKGEREGKKVKKTVKELIFLPPGGTEYDHRILSFFKVSVFGDLGKRWEDRS